MTKEQTPRKKMLSMLVRETSYSLEQLSKRPDEELAEMGARAGLWKVEAHEVAGP